MKLLRKDMLTDIKELEAVGFKVERFEREADTGLATFVARR